MIKKRSHLTTEKQNPRSKDIDALSTLEIVKRINAEDRRVAPAVAKEGKRIAAAVDVIVEQLKKGGRLFYVGAGTSGRLGVLDASECPPTFGVSPSRVRGIIAGGHGALVRSVEGAEDRAEEGEKEMDKNHVNGRDVVVGIAACGLTPYVGAALKRARRLGAKTLFITCAPEAVGHIPADIIINPVVGPEMVAGSTRMKAGTATKLVLNTLSTSVMIKMGKVYSHFMVDLRATNEKLRDRSQRILMEITGLSRPQAKSLLEKAQGRVKPAIVMHAHGVALPEALKILDRCDQSLRKAMKEAL